jgi:hypothetical protein
VVRLRATLPGRPAMPAAADEHRRHRSRRRVPTTRRRFCDLLIFVDQAAEPVASWDTLEFGRGVLDDGVEGRARPDAPQQFAEVGPGAAVGQTHAIAQESSGAA